MNVTANFERKFKFGKTVEKLNEFLPALCVWEKKNKGIFRELRILLKKETKNFFPFF
jgi:septation ring formation regulator EzrA